LNKTPLLHLLWRRPSREELIYLKEKGSVTGRAKKKDLIIKAEKVGGLPLDRGKKKKEPEGGGRRANEPSIELTVWEDRD